VAYQTIGVTAYLRAGENALGAIPASGWHARSSFNADTPGPGPFHGRAYPVPFRAQLEIEYRDGTRQTVATDETWTHTDGGPWRWAELCQGVTYDFRKVIPGWNEPGFDDSDWKPAKASGLPRDLEIIGMHWAPYGVIGEFEPAGITEPEPGVFVVDFGRVLGGFPKLTVQGRAGQVVKTTPGQMLNPDGTVNTIAYKFARNSCELILDGEGPNTLEPDFTYHCYGYIQIEGLENREQLIAIKGIHASNLHRQTLEFTSSDPALDKLVEMHRVTFQVNNQSFLTDVADRDERGEYFFSAEQGEGWFFLENAGAIQRRTSHSMISSFSPETGMVSNLAAGQPAQVAMAGFTDGILEMPLQLLAFYNDHRTLERAYEPAAQTFRTLVAANPDGLARNQFSAFANNWSGGDKTMRFDGESFLDRSERTDDVVYQTAWFYRSLRHLEQIAGWLEKSEDETFFSDAAKRSAEAIVGKLVSEDGKVRGGTQVGHSIAIWSGLLDKQSESNTVREARVGFGSSESRQDFRTGKPAETLASFATTKIPRKILKAKVVSQLLHELEQFDNHLTAGGYGGVTSLFAALSDNGHHDLAWHVMMRPDYPSYGFMVKHTGGGVWENFDSWHDKLGFNTKAMNSQCHPDQATILPWIVHRLAGIRPGHGPDAGGFKHFEIYPQLVDSLNAVSCRFHSARGLIVVSYKRTNQTFEMTVEIPPNTSAALTLPDGTRHEVESGSYEFNMSRDTE
jgi:alpha-L-rhamnosidase